MKKIYATCILLFIIAVSAAQNKSYISWLNEHLLPIKTVYAENGLEDLKKLDSFIDDTRIIGLGECTHGSSEVFSMKHRMLEYLVKEKGFTIFSIEANMPEAYRLNDYIINGKGNARELLAGMYFWTWNTQEVLDMIEWMKKYNDTANKKIYFTGFDMQFYKMALQNVKEFCIKNNINLSDKIIEFDSIASKFIYALKNKNYETAPRLMELATSILHEFESSAAAKQDSNFTWIKQNATILWQFAASNAKKQYRDISMAQNVQWIAEQNPSCKIVLWAHNGHINKKKYWMGKYLETKFGKDYIAIGFATEQGKYTAFNRINNLNKLESTNILEPSSKADYEYYLKAADIDNYFLPVNNLAQNKGSDFLTDTKKLRHIGAATVEGKHQFLKTNLTAEYDAIIFLRTTNASKLFIKGN